MHHNLLYTGDLLFIPLTQKGQNLALDTSPSVYPIKFDMTKLILFHCSEDKKIRIQLINKGVHYVLFF